MVCHRRGQPLCYGPILLIDPVGCARRRHEATARERNGTAETSGVADIFHEVEEDLRRDQAAAIWKKYGNYIVGAALLLVLAVAAHWGWTKYSTNQQLQASADFLSGTSTNDLKAREDALCQIATDDRIDD